MNRIIPLLKEYRLSKLTECLRCIDNNQFNREKQRNCILDLYPPNPKGVEHMEKSIFRGMVIPSLRHLELIIGYGSTIKLAANGKLIIESELINSNLYARVLRAIIFEIDRDVFQFLELIKKEGSVKISKFIDTICGLIEGSSTKQKKERISKWISILEQAQLIQPNEQQGMDINDERFSQTALDLQQTQKHKEDFRDYLFESYRELSKDTAGIVDIRACRESVSMKMLKNEKIILTEKIFDEMLRVIRKETPKYRISFGKPMGAKEKLFRFNDNYFITILVQFNENLSKKEIKR